MQKATYSAHYEIYTRVAGIAGIMICIGFSLWLYNGLGMQSVLTGTMTGLVSAVLAFMLIWLVKGIDGYRKHRELCKFMILWRDTYRQHTNWWEIRTRRAIMDGEHLHVGATEHEKKAELHRIMDLWAHDINEEYVQTCRYLTASVQALHISQTIKLEYMSVLCEEACVVREHERDVRKRGIVENYDDFMYDWFADKMLVRMGMKNPPVRPEYKTQGDSHD